MKKYPFFLLIATVLLPLAISCGDDETDPVPIAPLLKEIVMPSETAAMPGTDVTIKGRGFDTSDIIICKSQSGEADFTPKVVSVTDYGITIAVPATACGFYEVSDTRAELTTVLSEKLYIPYVIILDDIDYPATVKQGETITVKASGIEAGDVLVMESDAYPSGVKVKVEGAQNGSITFAVPSTCYGVNTMKVTRGQKMGTLGTISVAVNLFAKVAGGIVFYTSDDGVHGLVVYMGTLGDAAMNWGPAVPSAFAAASKYDVYSGKTNSTGLLKQVSDTKNDYTYSHDTPVQLCDKLEAEQDGIKYNDYFLPSLNELVEFFKVKAKVANAGFSVPANNYWSSTEADYSGGWVWAMCYCNFYESTNIVTGIADRTGWAIGTIAIREF